MLHCPSPIGRLTLVERDGGLCALLFPDAGRVLTGPEAETPLLREAARQLGEYFAGQRRAFDLPLSPGGTPFQRKVWAALADIPYGETRSYRDIAAAIGAPGACRAVGMANHRNPLPILVPCHRVVGTDGSLTGYAGGLAVKGFLLALERA